jgi:F420-non-reducing hydrogenase small subunit
MTNDNHKFRLAMYWAAGCGGCEIAVLNINEVLLDVAENFEIVFWPVAVDTKIPHVEELPDGHITVCLFNGAIRSSENEEMARLLRRKSQVLVAFGACACEGGIPALANLSGREELLDTVYLSPTTVNPEKVYPRVHTPVPEGVLELPLLYRTVKTLDQVVPIDYSIPGCPPESHQITRVMQTVISALKGEIPLPPPGATLGGGSRTVCDECPRARGEKTLPVIKRLATSQPSPKVCLLEQGFPCAGIATRDGCDARCPRANAPCAGCYGPPEGTRDQGARLISSLASIVPTNTAQDAGRVLDGIVDPAGTFYRFSLASSYLHRAKPQERGEEDPWHA